MHGTGSGGCSTPAAARRPHLPTSRLQLRQLTAHVWHALVRNRCRRGGPTVGGSPTKVFWTLLPKGWARRSEVHPAQAGPPISSRPAPGAPLGKLLACCGPPQLWSCLCVLCLGCSWHHSWSCRVECHCLYCSDLMLHVAADSTRRHHIRRP